MATVLIKNLQKIYTNNVQAVYDFNLKINDKEFIVLVGPSGCGKSTTLRMVAGLEDITSGELYIDEVFSNDLAPKNRNISMVFQNYALYPHMTVYENLAFGLKNKKVPTLQVNFKKYADFLLSQGKTKEEVEKEIERAKIERTGVDDFVIYDIDKARVKSLNKEQKDLIAYKAQLESKINIAKSNPNFVLNGDEEMLIKNIDDALVTIRKELEYYTATEVPSFKNMHLPKSIIDDRVHEVSKILDIEQYLKRKPKALSGGQCQRVALGRAIVKNSKVFLMDEPLSNLDAKLRVQMRSELVRLHKKIGSTTIYVTHDQTEAMTMADRIVVMKSGYIQQIGTPLEIYNKPVNRFVATFIGAPSMNIIPATLKAGKVYLNDEVYYELGEKKTEVVKRSITEAISREKKYIENLKALAKNSDKETIKEMNKQYVEFVKLGQGLCNSLFVENKANEVLDTMINDKENKKSKAKFKSSKKDTPYLASQLEDKVVLMDELISLFEQAFTKKTYKVLFGIRPEDISIENENNGIPVFADVVEMMGDIALVHCKFEGTDVIAKIPSGVTVTPMSNISIKLNEQKIYFFNALNDQTLS